MSESTFTKHLRDFLSDNGGGSIKLGASIFLAKGTPDMICFYKRFTFFMEDKVWPNPATSIQKATINKIREQGGHAWVATLMPNGKIDVEGREFDGPEQLFEFCVASIGRPN